MHARASAHTKACKWIAFACVLVAAPALRADANATPESAQQVVRDDSIKGLLFGSSDLEAEFHGFVNFEYADIRNDPDHPVSSFDLHNVYLAAKARVGSSVTLFAEIEYEHGAIVQVDRAFVDWQLASFFTVRAGRFYVPLSYERTHYWAPVRIMTSRPLTVDLPFHEWADTGLEVFGRYRWFGYDFALVNGPRALTESGIPRADIQDNNQNKTVVGRLNVYPHPAVEAGVAYAVGAYDDQGQRRFRLFEADLRFHRGALDLWLEYDRRTGDDEPCNVATDPACNPIYSGDRARKQGYYVLASYTVIENERFIHYLKPIVRYDSVELLDGGGGTRRLTAGLNWSPAAHVVFKSEYQWSFPLNRSSLQSNGLMASMTADF